MTTIDEELDLYYDDKEYKESYLDKRKKCYLCDNVGIHRYAPYDFVSNWSEEERWRCATHGDIAIDNCEWDYFPDKY